MPEKVTESKAEVDVTDHMNTDITVDTGTARDVPYLAIRHAENPIDSRG